MEGLKISKESAVQKKKRPHHKDRVTLSSSNLEKVSAWVKFFESQFPGVKVKEQDIVNEIIEQASPEPTKTDLERLHKKFFDEVKHLEWVLKQAKSARAKGREFKMTDHMPKIKAKKSPVRSRKTQKSLPDSGLNSASEKVSNSTKLL